MIRSLTIGLPLGAISPESCDDALRRILANARPAMAKADQVCRTVRLTLPPAGPDFEVEGSLGARVRLAEGLAVAHDIRWLCLPLDYVAEGPTSVRSAEAVSLLSRHQRVFLNYMLAQDGEIATSAANVVGRDVLRISRLSNNGFDNFRVGASFNCNANNPFFPFSHHMGRQPAFSFALETTPLALQAVREASHDLGATRLLFTRILTTALSHLDELGRSIEESTGVDYRGADASLAPLPDGQMSVAAVIEGILRNPVGGHGTVLATAVLTDGIREAFKASGARMAGFNGVMYSVLEDLQLADAVSRRHVSLEGLTSFASVCGCGLDMVPIPGTTFPEEIAAVVLDIAAMSSALGKPLGVRLLPIPAKSENEFTSFNQDFLCDSRIVPLRAHPLHESNTAKNITIKSTVSCRD